MPIILIILIVGATVFALNNKDVIKNSMHFLKPDRTMLGENSENNSENTSNETLGSTAVDTSKWDMTRVNVVADTEGVYVPVPKGFVASGATGEHTVKTGFVIYEGDEPVDDTNAWEESKTRNQFVWVPVLDTTRVFEEIGTTGRKKAKLWEYSSTGRSAINNEDTDTRREPGILNYTTYEGKRQFVQYGMQEYTRKELYQELGTSFDRDMESIKKYGGFYIGRYETGNIASEKPIIQRMNIDIYDRNWYTMYLRMKNISTNKNIETSMIWGCLYDETLQWLIDTETKTQEEVGFDSTEWGNYKNATFTYTNTSGATLIKSASSSIRLPTGSAERNKANNIYDIAGNVMEWTLEGNGNTNRYMRGGSCFHLGNESPVCYRYKTEGGTIGNNYGIRAHLCIK